MKIHALVLAAALALAASLTANAGPISKGGFVISKPGKYFLTKNLTVLPIAGLPIPVGVVIEANDVELDLAGYSIGPGANQPGIGVGVWLSDDLRRVRVRNGRLQSVKSGVSGLPFGYVYECLFERLQVADCAGSALVIYGGANVIRGCVVTNLTNNAIGIGIFALGGTENEISDCSVLHGGGTAISSAGTDGLLVRRCFVTHASVGIAASAGCKLMDNVTSGCTTKFSGNPVLLGVND